MGETAFGTNRRPVVELPGVRTRVCRELKIRLMLRGRTFSTDTDPGEDLPVVNSPCALGCGMATTSALDAQKLVGLVALSKDLGLLGIKRLNHETMNPELQPNSVERRPKSSRRPTPNKASSTASSFAEACERGHDAEQQGRVRVLSGGCSNIHHMCWPCARFWLCIGCYFSPRGRDDRSRAPPTAARPSVCPSPDLWASFLPSLGAFSPVQGSKGTFEGYCGVECADGWRARAAGLRLLQMRRLCGCTASASVRLWARSGWCRAL